MRIRIMKQRKNKQVKNARIKWEVRIFVLNRGVRGRLTDNMRLEKNIVGNQGLSQADILE